MAQARISLLILLLLVANGTAAAQGQQPPSVPTTPRPGGTQQDCTIAGRVLRSENLREVESVLVKLTDRGIPRDQTFTDSRGAFRFAGLPQGFYRIEVQVEGYKLAVVEVDLTFICRTEGNMIMLEREIEITQAQPEGSTVSARDLQIPKDARKEFEKGMNEAQKKNRPERSLPHFQKAIEIYPDFDAAYLQLALAHLSLKQDADAQSVLERAVGVNAESAPAHLLLGMVHTRRGNTNDSVRELREAVRLDETNWLSHYELGRALLMSSLPNAAHPHALRAHELNPQSPKVHLLLHDVSIQRDDLETALAEVNEYMKLFPQDDLVPRLKEHSARLQNALRPNQP